ncbi:FixH family protein [Emticicia sp. 17c]|uniref:FixH family protein n=1 Tax=Emticicia sp. 17c TaxID=3127704 RepID=UPI00301BA259
MNWGHKIGILYGLFVVFMLTLVTLCIKQKDISLVSDDYYKKEIAYQAEIEKQHNAAGLSVPVSIKYDSNTQSVGINFPENQQGATGKIQFYRPADAKKDFNLALNLGTTATQQIPVATLLKGLWVVKIEWEKSGIQYSTEEKIVL